MHTLYCRGLDSRLWSVQVIFVASNHSLSSNGDHPSGSLLWLLKWLSTVSLGVGVSARTHAPSLPSMVYAGAIAVKFRDQPQMLIQALG